MPDQKDFVIKDRRVFASETTEEKEKKPDRPDREESSEEKTPSAEKPEAAFEETASNAPQDEAQMPEINFATFIMSLNASAMVSLGIIDDPVTGTKTKNLPVGKQTIDILGMLEEKTKGNLTEDEAAMLKNILYDLRILYVKEKE